MVRSVFFLNDRSAVLSVLVRLSVGLFARLIILTDSCLASSAISEGSDLMAFSTPVSRSSMVDLRGVTAKFKPFCSSECTPSTRIWILWLITVPFMVLFSDSWVFWRLVNLRCCLLLVCSPTCVALLKVRRSIKSQYELDKMLVSRRWSCNKLHLLNFRRRGNSQKNTNYICTQCSSFPHYGQQSVDPQAVPIK